MKWRVKRPFLNFGRNWLMKVYIYIFRAEKQKQRVLESGSRGVGAASDVLFFKAM